MYTAIELEKAFSAGSEVVVVSEDRDYNSAIWYSDRDGNMYTFSRAFGTLDRTFDRHHAACVLHDLQSDGVTLFIRGYEEW